jgi:hypothetical protein
MKTEKYRAIMRKANKNIWKDHPHPKGMLGKKHSEATKKKFKARPPRFGVVAPAWKGGTQGYWSDVARRTVFKMYKKRKVCELCGFSGRKRRIVVHHKNKDITDNRIENLIVLCEYCHMAIFHKVNIEKAVRLRWIKCPTFRKKLEGF